jgi:hypothetical protein
MKIMKPQLSFFAALLVLGITFSGCNDDDENTSSLIGSWRFVSDVNTECADTDDNYSETCSRDCDVIVITATTITADGDVYTYTTSGNQLTFSEIVNNVQISYTLTFNVSGSTLTLTTKDSADLGSCKNVTTYSKV